MDTDGYVILQNVLNEQTLKLLKTQSKLFERAECFKKNKFPSEYPYGDSQCPTSFAKYGLLCYEALLLTLKPIIETQVGKELIPTYSYSRIYYKDSVLEKHRDRPSCEYSATICISIDQTPWDIFFTVNKKNVCISLYPGDLIVYKGTQLEHWREKYTGNEQIQVFLHYVDKNGEYSQFANDKRAFLGIEK
uniref:Ferrochelatase n=1 Tax=viral metagenome TaxID=1070528 RepID=A0A6C0B7D1_9ZZZZ